MSGMLITSGAIILTAAIMVGFIRVDDAQYMHWRLIFATGEGLAIAAGIVLVAVGLMFVGTAPTKDKPDDFTF